MRMLWVMIVLRDSRIYHMRDLDSRLMPTLIINKLKLTLSKKLIKAVTLMKLHNKIKEANLQVILINKNAIDRITDSQHKLYELIDISNNEKLQYNNSSNFITSEHFNNDQEDNVVNQIIIVKF